MDRAQAPHFNYVGDSILGQWAHIGAGVILSNLKIDKSDIVIRHHSDLQGPLEDTEAANPYSRSADDTSSKANYEIKTGRRKLGAIIGDFAEVGCGAVLNPGTVIGKHSVVYPLTSFRGILPSNRIAKSDTVIVKRD
jgi:acetyltransferase-like isoleucine patch superfamily enzyme